MDAFEGNKDGLGEEVDDGAGKGESGEEGDENEEGDFFTGLGFKFSEPMP